MWVGFSVCGSDSVMAWKKPWGKVHDEMVQYKRCRITTVLKIDLISFVNVIIGTPLQNKLWRLCCIPCKLRHCIMGKSCIWKWPLRPTALVYQYSSWLQNWSFQHRKGNTRLQKWFWLNVILLKLSLKWSYLLCIDLYTKKVLHAKFSINFSI